MIARYWSATTTKPAEEYRRHFQQTVVANLEALDGFQGCYLLETQVDGATRFDAEAINFGVSVISPAR